MADIIKNKDELKIENYFVDGDTRTITLKNPKDTIAQADILSLQSFMQSTNIIIGDRSGATFGRINKATKVIKQQIDLDIDSV